MPVEEEVFLDGSADELLAQFERHLTQRQAQVVRLHAELSSYKAVAERLGVSEGTVKAHSRAARNRLRAMSA